MFAPEPVPMQQALITFKPDTSEAEVQAYLLTLRRLAGVAQVELLTDDEARGIVRRPTGDESPDTTYRGGHAFFKGPDGALMQRLTPAEADVVNLLAERVRAGAGPVEGAKALLRALQEALPDTWGKKRGASSATDAYASARAKLLATGWDLVAEPAGTYYFQRLLRS
jgi:hypothetical protein